MILTNVILVSCPLPVIEYCKARYNVTVFCSSEAFQKCNPILMDKAQLVINYQSKLQENLTSHLCFKIFPKLKACITTKQNNNLSFFNQIYDYLVPGFSNLDMTIESLKEFFLSLEILEQTPSQILKRLDFGYADEEETLIPLPKNKIYSVEGLFPGNSKAMLQLHKKIRQAANNDSPVLLLGETGTGKSTAASLIHRLSSRKTKAFRTLDLSSVVPNLAESLLFGTMAHAYTDAINTSGLLDEANGGTIFFDEICNGTLEVQANLLSPTETKQKTKVGSTKTENLDIRMIFATNADIAQRIQEGSFKKDLYYRIYDNTIQIPPLRDHIEDLRDIILHFSEKEEISFHQDAISCMENHTWPGNYREFENCLEAAKNNCENKLVLPEDLTFGLLR